MKRSIALLLIIQSLWAAATIVISPGSAQLDLGALSPDDGSYFDAAGNIQMTVSGKTVGHSADVYVQLQNPLRNQSGDVIPRGALAWQIFWASTDGNKWTGVSYGSSAGFTRPVPYEINADTRVLNIPAATNADVSMTLGTQLRIPAVQPAGRYAGTILVTVTEN